MDEKKPGVQNVSTKLRREDVEALQAIAKSWGITPHAVRVFAIRHLIAEIKAGYKPKKKTKTVAILEP